MKKFNALNKKTIITGVLAFLCALLVAVSFGLLGGSKTKMADAQTSSQISQDLQLGELTLSDYTTRSDGKVFNGVVLDKLYNALLAGTGNSGQKTIADFNGVLTSTINYGSVALPMYRDAYDLYQANNNKNIVLKFGGYEWTVTFLTRTGEGSTSDHVIATLWLTDLLKTSSGNPVYTSNGWANSANGGNQTTLYPGDLYSTSQARVEALNAGGVVATSGNSANTVQQNPNHQLAKFTMPSATGSLTDYIVKPNDVKYQHYENWVQQWTISNGSGGYPLHNEALNEWNGNTNTATAANGAAWCSNYDYTGKTVANGYTTDTAYDAWGNDYVWLPSVSETGSVISTSGSIGAIGFWKTTYNVNQNTRQPAHTSNGYTNGSNDGTNISTNIAVAGNTNYAWLRTGFSSIAHYRYYLAGNGSYGVAYPASQLAVRPALHLDLTAAATVAALETPRDVTQYEDSGTLKDIVYDYNKTWQLTDFGKGASWYDFASYLSNTQFKYKTPGDTAAFTTAAPGAAVSTLHNAGRYHVEFTLPSTSLYKFENGAATATCIITIKQKEIEYEPKLYKGNTPVNTITYGDTGGAVKLNLPTINDSGDLAPAIKIYYKGTGYPDTTNETFDSDGYNSDKSMHQTHGSTTFPTGAGTSYNATIVDLNEKTSNYKLKLSSGASNPFAFNIGKKEVTLPTVSTANKTYNGQAQNFDIANYDPDVLDITSIEANGNTLSLNGTNYDDGNGKYTVTPSLTATPYKFTATEAAEYKVTWVIKQAAQTDYTWASTVINSDKTTIFTVDQASLDLTLNYPAGTTFPIGTTGNITVNAGGLTGILNSDPVTVNIGYYLKPPTGNPPATTWVQTDVDESSISLDMTNFTSTGTYVIWVQTSDDSNGSDINRNYKFTGRDTNTNPVTENVFVQQVQVGTGAVDVSGLKWGWSTTQGGTPTEILTNSDLVYTKTNGAVQTYYVSLIQNSIPSYLEVDISYGSNGFTGGYAGNVERSATTTGYSAQVRLKINNSDYTFDSADTSYNYISDTVATVNYTWYINAKELDFSDAVWEFSSNAIDENDDNAQWTRFSETDTPEFTGSGYTYIRLNKTYLQNLGLDAGDYSVSYGSTNKQILANTSTTTNVTIALNTTNYKLQNTTPPHITYNWEIGNKKIHITGWGNSVTLTHDGKAYSIPRVQISNTDQDYTQFLEYVYSYQVPPATPQTDVSETTMVSEVFPVADISNQISGTITVRLTTAGAQQYALDGMTSWTFTCGASKTMVTVGIDGTHTEYDDGGDFALTGTYHPGNVETLPEVDFVAQNGVKLEVTITDKDGQVKVFTANNAGDPDVVAFLSNAGVYTVDFKITDAQLDNAYALSDSQIIYTVARKGIVAPQVIKALTFTGGDVIFTDHLDNQYTANTSIIEVTGDNNCRNVLSNGSYNVSLKLLDNNYCWILPERSIGGGKGKIRVSLAADEVATELELSPDLDRAIYSWNVAPLKIDSSKMWNNGQLKLTPELANLVNNGFVGLSYNYYDSDNMLVGNSAEGFKPEGGKSYRVEAVLGGDDADMGNVVFVSSNGDIVGNTSDKVAYTPKKTGMAKFKDTLTTKYAGLPLWAWIVIGVCALILLIVLICIIVAACKRRKKKKEEEEAKKEKEEAKAAEAASAAAPILAISASMADERAKLEAEKAKMEAELAKAKMEAEAEAARAKAQAEADAAKARAEAEAEAARAKAQAELDLQKAKTEAEIARMRAEAQAAQQQAQQQPAPAPAPQPQPVQQPVQQPVYQQPQPQYIPMPQPQPQPQYIPVPQPQPQPQYIPMPMPQPQYSMPQQSSGGNGGGSSSLEHMLMEMKAQQAISEAKNEAQFRIMSAENKAAQEVAEAKAQARNNGNQMPQYPPMMGMGMNPMMGMGMGMAMPPMMGYPQPQPQPQAQQQGNGNSPVILTIGPNGEVKQVSPQAPAPVVQQPQVQPILINVTQPTPAQAQPAAQQLSAPATTPAQAQPVAQEPAQPLSAQYPPGAVVTTTTTVDTTKTASNAVDPHRRRNDGSDMFDVDGFYDKYEGNM